MRFSGKWAGVALVMVAGASLGCRSYTLDMAADLPIRDDTSVSPQLKERKYRKVMVIPPSGTARGQFDREISFFEREFLKHGLTVISSAVTGRVVLEGGTGDGERKNEGAQSLSDAERALVMAKKSGADAILQIGAFNWSSKRPVRYFASASESATGKGVFSEVPLKDYEVTPPKMRMNLGSPVLEFIGRLVDVQSGEVMGSYKYACAQIWSLPSPWHATFKPLTEGEWLIKEQSYDLSSGTHAKEAEERTINKIITPIAERIAGK